MLVIQMLVIQTLTVCGMPTPKCSALKASLKFCQIAICEHFKKGTYSCGRSSNFSVKFFFLFHEQLFEWTVEFGPDPGNFVNVRNGRVDQVFVECSDDKQFLEMDKTLLHIQSILRQKSNSAFMPNIEQFCLK